MRKVGGRVSFGGRVAFCAQTAWIQNATLVSTTFCITTRFLMLFFRGRILPLDNHSKRIGYAMDYLIKSHSTSQVSQYWKAVEDASLVPDLQVLADGDLTEVRMVTFWDAQKK